jgi:hypothetical protein
MNKTWKAVLGVVLIFIFGWLSGALCTSLIVRHRAISLLDRGPAAIAEVLERRMTHNLNLDPGQRQQIHGYFMENLTQRLQLQKEIQPQVQALNRQTIEEINAVLHPDQQERFQENIARIKLRFGKNPFNPNAEPSSGMPATNSAVGSPPSH